MLPLGAGRISGRLLEGGKDGEGGIDGRKVVEIEKTSIG